MARNSRWVSFVAKLNRETQEGKIRWRVAPQSDLPPSGFQQYRPAYTAEFGEGIVRIFLEYVRETNEYRGEYWDESVAIEIKTSRDADFVRIPDTPGDWDLFETVSYKANDLDKFIEKFLKSG